MEILLAVEQHLHDYVEVLKIGSHVFLEIIACLDDIVASVLLDSMSKDLEDKRYMVLFIVFPEFLMCCPSLSWDKSHDLVTHADESYVV